MTVGSQLLRGDGLGKVLGQTRYTADLDRKAALVGRFCYIPATVARIHSIDTTEAAALPGVYAVITQSDLPDARYGLMVKDRTLFADGIVRYEAEPVAAVAAIDDATARAAVDLIRVEYTELDPVVDPVTALDRDAPCVHARWEEYTTVPGLIRNGNVCGHCTIVRGDVDAAMASAAHTVSDEFATDMSHPVPIEPRAVIAEWDGDRVTIWSSTQVPYVAQSGVAECLQISLQSVRVIVPALGGGFGGKCDVGIEPHVAALARAAGRPVRLVFDRHEEFVQPDMRHHPMRIAVESAIDADGRITGRRARVVLDTGAYAAHGPFIGEIASLLAAGPYAIENLDISVDTVYTNNGPSGSVRGPGGPQMTFAVEQHIDRCGEITGLGGIEIRRRNLMQDGDLGPTGQIMTAVGVRDALERALELIGDPTPTAPADDTESRWREGVGVSVSMWPSFPMASGASVRVDSDGSVRIVTGAQENGSGAVMGLALIVGEELGVPADEIQISYQDTAVAPFDHGSGGSQTTFNNGRAVQASAVAVRDQIVEWAAQRFEIAPEDIEFAGGKVGPTGTPSKAITLAEVAIEAWYGGRVFAASAGPPGPPPPVVDVSGCAGRIFVTGMTAPTFAAHAARVQVDCDTGVVRVVDYAAVHDIGRVLNPMGAHGQVEGGVVHGIGIALVEGAQLVDGRHLNADLLGYKLLTAADVPPIKVDFIERPAPDGGPYGLKGAGEPPATPPAGAIANAIAHAVGARLRKLPMTAPRVLEILDEMSS